MAKDYIPMADGELTGWLRSFKTNIGSSGAQLGLSPEEIAGAQQLCTEYIEQIKTAYEAKLNAKSQNQKKKSMRKTHLQALRQTIGRIKKSAAYSNTFAIAMHLNGHDYNHTEETYQPELKLRLEADLIEVKFKKRGIQALEFWGQFNGGEWMRLGTKTYSPAYFKPDNYQPGTLVDCRIKAIGIKKDKPFGQWSNAVFVAYKQG